MNTRKMQQALTIDLTRFTAHEIRVGPDRRGPAKCLQCHQAFKAGEVWQRMKSLPDPEYGSYYIGVHSKCPTQMADAFTEVM